MNLAEDDNLEWQFDELLKTLIAMSLPSDEQKIVYGIGATADEMLNDYYSFYTLIKERLSEEKFINPKSEALLDEIDDFTNKLSNEKDEEFWYQMDRQEEWELLRQMSKSALKALNKENLKIEVSHEIEHDKYGKATSQRTQVKLIGK